MTNDDSQPRRSGRRRGHQDTRGEILHSARQAFAEGGFAGTSIRRVAALAEVDPALVHHYFGTKRLLFLASVEIPVDIPAEIQQVIVGGLPGLGDRLIRTIVRLWESPVQPTLVSSFRTALADPELAGQLRDFLSLEVLDRVPDLVGLTPGEGQRRIGLVASQIVGIIVGRYILQLPALADQTTEELCRSVGPTLQHYLEGDLDTRAR